MRYIVDFRSARKLPYDHRSVANTDTRCTPNILGRGCFYISLWRPVREASALSGSLIIRCSAPKLEDSIVRSARWVLRGCVARGDVAPQLREATIIWYLNQSLVPGFWTKYHIVVASSGSAATSYHTTQTRRRRCALLTMASSMFGAKQRINEPKIYYIQLTITLLRNRSILDR